MRRVGISCMGIIMSVSKVLRRSGFMLFCAGNYCSHLNIGGAAGEIVAGCTSSVCSMEDDIAKANSLKVTEVLLPRRLF